MFATMLRRDRERNGLRIARASWLCGVIVPRLVGRACQFARLRDL